MRIRDWLGLTVGSLAMALTPHPASCDDLTIDDVQEVTSSDWREHVAEGYSVVLIYGSDPKTDLTIRNNSIGVDLYLRGIDDFSGVAQYYTIDTQKLFEELGSEDAVTAHLDRTFGVRQRPSLVFFCDGERVYQINGLVPKDLSRMTEAGERMGPLYERFAKGCE
jgi:hypothetical protein